MIRKLNPSYPRSRRKGRSRATVMLEFALILPVALAIMLFAVDMGRLVLLSTGLHDATAVSARAGARQGYIGTSTKGPVKDAFAEASKVVPGLETSITGLIIQSPRTTFSSGARTGAWCTQSDIMVKVTANADIQFITPGLGSLLTMMTGNDSKLPGAVNISSTGVARCEVAR